MNDTLCFSSKFLNVFENLNVIPSLQEFHEFKSQTYFHCSSAESTKIYFSRTSALVVVCSSSQNKNSTLMSPEWINLTKTSNWLHEVTSVESSTRKYKVGDAFIYHLVFHIFQRIWNVPLNSIAGKRYSSHVCLTIVSPRSNFTVFNKRFHKRSINRARFFAWQFQVRLHMKPAFFVKTCGKTSLTLQTCFMASEEF